MFKKPQLSWLNKNKLISNMVKHYISKSIFCYLSFSWMFKALFNMMCNLWISHTWRIFYFKLFCLWNRISWNTDDLCFVLKFSLSALTLLCLKVLKHSLKSNLGWVRKSLVCVSVLGHCTSCFKGFQCYRLKGLPDTNLDQLLKSTAQVFLQLFFDMSFFFLFIPEKKYFFF